MFSYMRACVAPLEYTLTCVITSNGTRGHQNASRLSSFLSLWLWGWLDEFFGARASFLVLVALVLQHGASHLNVRIRLHLGNLGLQAIGI